MTHSKGGIKGDSVKSEKAKPTHCQKGHPYTDENLRLDKNNRVHCRECDKIQKSAKRLLVQVPGQVELGVHLEFPARATPVSLEFPDPLEYEPWRQVVIKSVQVHDASNWWIGEGLNYGEGRFGEQFAQVIGEAKISEDKAQICMYVARTVDPSIRRKELTWSHHREVTKMEPADQVVWLQTAIDRDYSVRDLHEAIHGPKTIAAPADPDGGEGGGSEPAKCQACESIPAPIRICSGCLANLVGQENNAA
jgi:hypothetical protein